MIRFVVVDFQKEFTQSEGKCYMPRPSVDFVKNTFVPWCVEKKIKVAEIISDYRQPRPGDTSDCCYPGTSGYESEIPDQIKERGRFGTTPWIKCMNSPIWIREGKGEPDVSPGLPYQAPEHFDAWLKYNLEMSGVPNSLGIVLPARPEIIVLLGLTLDCCVLCVAQELAFRGYKVRILAEATDTESGNPNEKKYLLTHPPITKWAKPVYWEQVKKMFD